MSYTSNPEEAECFSNVESLKVECVKLKTTVSELELKVDGLQNKLT